MHDIGAGPHESGAINVPSAPSQGMNPSCGTIDSSTNFIRDTLSNCHL